MRCETCGSAKLAKHELFDQMWCKECLKVVSKDLSVIVHQPKIKGKTDSFFYDGDIITVTDEQGNKFSMIAEGDIRIDITLRNGRYVYRSGEIDTAIRVHKLSDKKLRWLSEKGKIEWVDNNWFGVYYNKSGTDEWDSCGETTGDYDEAVGWLVETIKEKRKEWAEEEPYDIEDDYSEEVLEMYS